MNSKLSPAYVLMLALILLPCKMVYSGFPENLPESWMPPTDVDWVTLRGASSGFLEASPIPNVDEVLWEAEGFGFKAGVHWGGIIPPLVAEGLVFLTDGENVYALSLDDGEVRWGLSVYWGSDDEEQYPWYVEQGLGLEVFIEALAYSDGKLFIATSADLYEEKGRVVCLEASTGRHLWTSKLPGDGDTQVTSNIVAFKGHVYVGTVHSTHMVYKLTQSNGRIVWSVPLGSSNIRGVSVSADTVYVVDENGLLYAVNDEKGVLAWSVNPGLLELSIPVVYGNRLYLTSGVGELIQLDAEDGSIISKLDASSSPQLPPTLYGELLFIAEALGEVKKLVAYSRADWSVVWRFAEPSVRRFTTPPMITVGSQPKVVLGAEGEEGNFILAVYALNGSLAWKHWLPDSLRAFGLAASRGRLILAQLGDGRFEGSVTVFAELEKPTIADLAHTPDRPRSIDTVNVTCRVSDLKSGLYKVMLSWSLDRSSWNHVEMAKCEGGLLCGVIPTQPNGTTVYYRVTAIDNVGNWGLSEEGSYTVLEPVIPPRVRVRSPSNGTLVESDRVMVSWTLTEGTFKISKVEVRLDAGSWVDVTGETSYELTGLTTGSHTITVRAVDERGNAGYSRVNFEARPPEFPTILVAAVVGAIAALTVVAVILRRR